MTDEQFENLKRKDKLYFARVMPKLGYYEILDVSVSTKTDTYCTVSDVKTKQSYPCGIKYAKQCLYKDRKDALEYLKQQREENKGVKLYYE